MSCDATLEPRLHALVVRALRDAPRADARALAWRHARVVSPLTSERDLGEVVEAVVARVRGLGPLEALLGDPAVGDVLVNAGRDVWFDRGGVLERADVVLAPGEAEALIERIVAPLGRRIDRSTPIAEARLADGSRVQALVPPLAVDGPSLTIRRFSTRPLPLDAFGPPEVVAALQAAVVGGANVVVVGGTSSGKTTLLNAMGSSIPDTDRVVTIEDTAELRLAAGHVVRLEARPASADGAGAVTMRDLVRAALRMRPDRIVVGEVRGAEALELVIAMNTGHRGCLATCHANGTVDALARLETLVLLADCGLPHDVVRRQLGHSIDAVVHVRRTAGRAARRIVAIAEVEYNGSGVRLVANESAVVCAPTRWSLT